jgi:aminoglycoside phosphotransferase (APT) family kinase protein
MQTDVVRRLLARADLAVDADSLAQLGPRSWSARTSEGAVLLRLVQQAEVHAVRAFDALMHASQERFPLLQRLHRCVPCDGGLIAVMEWIPGTTLREGSQDDLPAFFEQLARWHLGNAGSLPLYSRYTNLECASVEDFLSEELTLHLQMTGDRLPRDACWELLEPLALGFPTYVHGDVHPGNVMRRPGQGHALLDPEYLHIGVNYLDLDYVDWWGLEADPAPWWAIRVQARESVGAYFAALDADGRTIPKIMTAICLLTTLRSHTNAVRLGAGNCADLVARVRTIMEGGMKAPAMAE